MMNSKAVLFSLLVAFFVTTSQSAAVNNGLVAKYLCRNRSDGYQAIVPGSCSQYYECDWGKAILKTCANFYDPNNKKCVNNNPGCVVTIVEPLTCTGPCCGIADSGYAVDQQNQQIYYQCKGNAVQQQNSCANGLMFDLVTLQCAKSSVCTDCTTRKPPCRITTTTRKPCTTTSTPPCGPTTTTCTTTTCTTTTCTTTTCTTTTACTTTTCTTPTTTCTTPTTTCTTTTCTTPTTTRTTPTTTCTTPTTTCTTPTTTCTTPTTTTTCTTEATTTCTTTTPCITTPAC